MLSSFNVKEIRHTINLVKTHYQMLVAQEDAYKTANTTTLGIFEFVSMPFGLQNAAQQFQRFIYIVLHGLHFVYAYLDDLFVASISKKEHYHHLETVF